MNAIPYIPSGWTIVEGGASLADEEPIAAVEPIAETEAPVEVEPVAYDDTIPAHVELAGAAVLDRAALTAAVDIVKRAVEKRNTIPILSNVLLESCHGVLALVGTDLDMQIRVIVPAAIDEHFRTTMPAHMLESFMKKASKGDYVSLTTSPGAVHGKSQDGGTVAIEFEKAKYRLNTLPVADFPRMAPGELSHSFTMPGKEFWNMLDGTMAAISTEETRYYLNGVYAHVVQRGNQHAFTMVATDGHRLYRQEVEAQTGALEMPGVIIPRKTVDLLHKLLKGKACPEAVYVSLSATKIRVAYNAVEIVSKLVDGTFPDYQRVIPTGNNFPMTFDRDEMAEALQSVALISSECGRAVKFEITRGRCRLVVNNPDMGSSEAKVAVAWDAPDFEVGVSARYLESILEDAGAGEITMHFAEALRRDDDGKWVSEGSGSADCGSPIRVTGPREGWDAVLMPMRV